VNEGQKATGTAEASISLDPEQNSIYAKMAFAAFAKEKDDVISRIEFTELWTWLHPTGISQEMAGILGIPGPKERRRWFGTTQSPSRRQSSSGSSLSLDSNEDAAVTAGKVFDLISGGWKEEKEVTWYQFEAYAKKTPIFIKDLRQSFFNRLAQEMSTK